MTPQSSPATSTDVSPGLRHALAKMETAGHHPLACEVFAHYYAELERGSTGEIAESAISPVASLDHAEDLDLDPAVAADAFAHTAVIKLNGGLGTSMGMDMAKSLVEVREGLTFLDIICEQVRRARAEHDVTLPLVLMNSFRTQDDSRRALAAHPDIAVAGVDGDFLQSGVPRLLADDLAPVECERDRTLEWAPPGHGDIYVALQTSGLLDQLLEAGYRYASVSNADNLGATPSPMLAGWFAQTGAPFAIEACRRTRADRKGGHLAVRTEDGQLVLREKAQVAAGDAGHFGDVERHRFFNTNNLWLDLRQLSELLAERGGVLGLPLIRNTKTVDPTDPSTPAVIQIETAMGAAVEVFRGATAIEVDRTRFRPVKTTDDLLLLRSDVYELDQNFALVQTVDEAPFIDLAARPYAFIRSFEERFPFGPPSLREATSFTVRGDWTFGRRVVVRGDVALADEGSPRTVADGTVLSAEA